MVELRKTSLCPHLALAQTKSKVRCILRWSFSYVFNNFEIVHVRQDDDDKYIWSETCKKNISNCRRRKRDHDADTTTAKREMCIDRTECFFFFLIAVVYINVIPYLPSAEFLMLFLQTSLFSWSSSLSSLRSSVKHFIRRVLISAWCQLIKNKSYETTELWLSCPYLNIRIFERWSVPL